jgi:transposase InsO family protein
VVDYVRHWNERTEIPARQFVGWLGIGPSKFHDWKDRYGKRNEHNGWVPRDWWLEDWEKQAIIRFSFEYPLEGYRRLAFMMLDRDVVGRYVEHYNEVRLHSAIGYIAPADKLAGREAEIFAARDRKLTEARERRKEQREAARLQTVA